MDQITRKAAAAVTQFATYESSDPCIEREDIIECVEWSDGVVELAIDLRHNGRRTYIKINRADLLRIIREPRHDPK